MLYKEIIQKYSPVVDEVEGIYFIIEETLMINRSSLIQLLDQEINQEKYSLLEERLNKYKQGIPAQYIIGHSYFYGYCIDVNENVLIPRFDTEILIDTILNTIKNEQLQVVDIGTGSGCISIALKKHYNNLQIDAIDISKKALDVARKNIDKYQLDINLLENDLLKGITKQYDIIVSNPPYIDIDEQIPKIVSKNEPALALYALNEGLYYYEEILKSSINLLKKDGYIFFEIPNNKDLELKRIVEKYYKKYEIIKDYNQNSRVLKIWRTL